MFERKFEKLVFKSSFTMAYNIVIDAHVMIAAIRSKQGASNLLAIIRNKR
jgi:hypothetical protein